MIYIKRKISKGQTPKDRLEWKQASEYWTKESPVARGNNFNKTVREADIYDYHEIFLENGKRLDSYDPDNGYKILLCIPAVTKYDNIFL